MNTWTLQIIYDFFNSIYTATAGNQHETFILGQGPDKLKVLFQSWNKLIEETDPDEIIIGGVTGEELGLTPEMTLEN